MASSWINTLPASTTKPQRYQAVYRDRDGKQRSAGVFAKKADAKKALAEVLVATEKGTWVDPARGKVTVATYARRWLEGRQVAPSTRAQITGHVEREIIPAFGTSALRDVTPELVRAWTVELSTRLSPLTVRTRLVTLKGIFASAVEDGYISVSPVRVGTKDLPRREPKDKVFLTTEQIEQLIAAMQPRFQTLVAVAAWTGMRFGEVTGLEWKHVDLDNGFLLVRQAMSSGPGGKLYVGQPKSEASRRDVSLDDQTWLLLKKHKLATGGEGLVFTNSYGRPISHTYFRQRFWNPAVEAAFGGTIRPTFHDLRSSHISHLLVAGVDPMTIAKRVGHASPKMTYDVYGRVRADHVEAINTAITRVRGA